MTNRPAPDARPSSLHQRLTVALAKATDRARLAEVIAGDLGSVGVDGASPPLRSEDLWGAADGFAQGRAADRKDLRARLDAAAARTMHDCDTARHQLGHLMGWRRTLLEGDDWATNLLGELHVHLGAVEAARDALDERRSEQRAAQQDLDRVLEQRLAAKAAIDEADQQLGEVAGGGMDESGLRRELEAAGRAVQDAREVHDAALSRLEELQIEATGLDVRREASAPKDPVSRVPDATEVAAVTAVQEALAGLQSILIDGGIDSDARALATAWAELAEDMREVGGPAEGPSDDEREEAHRRVEATTEALSRLAAAKAASTLTAEQRQALDVAHAAVLGAEERAGRRRRSGGARRELEAAHAAEQALLEQHGFGGYLDVVLSGGRAAATDPNGPAIEREHFEATLALDALERAEHVTPEVAHLQGERTRLLGHITDLLGVDPGREVLPLLEAHRAMPRALQAPLVAALAAVDVHPVGESLEAAALRFLAAHPLPAEPDPAEAQADGHRQIERAAVDARAAALEGELAAAESEVDRSAEALQMAERSVEAFESELSVRAGEDLARMKRFAAAEQLRAQIDAVAATLRRAEEDARQHVEVADRAVTAAEGAFDQASADTSELARQARKLAEELPIDQRPDGDPLQTLPVLAASLRAHSEVLQPEIDRASAAVDSSSTELEEALAACRVAGTGDDGPQAEDLAEGLQQLLVADGDGPLVLDEPFVGVDHQTRDDLLEVLRTTATDRQLVLLTEDPDVLGWAIELPIDEGTAVPADALLARFRRANHGLTASTATESTPDSVDITTSTTEPDPAPLPTARRWAGQH